MAKIMLVDDARNIFNCVPLGVRIVAYLSVT
jgi:hypothetical protein